MPPDADQFPTAQAVGSVGQNPIANPNDKKKTDEIAHVLFLDIVGFTKLRSVTQRIVLEKLQEIVRATEEYCAAKNNKRLIALPTGDGMALVFLTREGGSGPAISCAEKIAEAIIIYNESAADEDSKIKVRMGVHSGNVVRVSDINKNPNVAGEGINTAQRVMDCGDVGHILLSDMAYHFLPGEPDRKDICTSFGEVKVKHDQKVSLHNLCNEKIGNKEIPRKVLLQEEDRFKRIMVEVEEAKKEESVKKGMVEVEKAERRKRYWALAIFGILALSASAIIFLMRAPQPPSAPSLSLAVLPFQPGTTKNSSKAISDGLTEQFIRSFKFLTTIKPLPLSTVRSTLNQKPSGQPESSQMLSPLEAGKRLRVRYVLTGTAEAYDDDPNLENIPSDRPPDFPVDVNVVLYDTEEGKPVWERPYKSTPFDQIIKLQKEIVKEVTDRMGGTMRKQEDMDIDEANLYTQKASAQWNYLRGRFLFMDRPTSEKGEGVTTKAISSYQKAIEIDPNYALAHAGLADVYNSISGNSMHPAQAKDEALKATKKALSSSEGQAEVYAAIGTEKWWLERDFTTAKIAFLLAIKLQPESANSYKRYSSFLAALGQKDEADKQIQEALRMEPASTFFQFTNGQNYFFARDYTKAINQLAQVATNRPTMSAAHRFLALAYEQAGKTDEALKHLTATKDESTDPEYSDNLSARGHILARMNQVNEALAIAQKLKQLRGVKGIYISPYNIALIYAEMPNREKEAFEWLDLAVKEFDPRVNWLKVDPRFDRLQQTRNGEFNDEFKELLRKVGLLP